MKTSSIIPENCHVIGKKEQFAEKGNKCYQGRHEAPLYHRPQETGIAFILNVDDSQAHGQFSE